MGVEKGVVFGYKYRRNFVFLGHFMIRKIFGILIGALSFSNGYASQTIRGNKFNVCVIRIFN
ncbi:MAG: hypothetical protein II367_07335 [Treponema sp.]|nr:hypothetical protein [Treponema sp.]